MEIISINESISILINHIEGFFEFLNNHFQPCSNCTVGHPGMNPRPPDGPEDIWRGDDCIKDNKDLRYLDLILSKHCKDIWSCTLCSLFWLFNFSWCHFLLSEKINFVIPLSLWEMNQKRYILKYKISLMVNNSNGPYYIQIFNLARMLQSCQRVTCGGP